MTINMAIFFSFFSERYVAFQEPYPNNSMHKFIKEIEVEV